MTGAGDPLQNALTVDVEDYFQVSAFADVVAREGWKERPSRVERNTDSLLELFERHGTRATFFFLGWVAERFPELVRRVHAAGHEIASHGFEHRLVYDLTPEAFREDLHRTAAAIEAAASVKATGFRAPSFSIRASCLWAYDVLREEGYEYSSSVFPVRHDRYGLPRFPRHPVRLQGDDGRSLVEFPMTTWRVLGRNLPVAGGGWMRVLPAFVTQRAIRKVNASGQPAMVYLHPWEVDPGQPRIASARRMARWRHGVNLHRTRARLEGLLQNFRFGTVRDVLGRLEAAPLPVLAPAKLSSLAGSP